MDSLDQIVAINVVEMGGSRAQCVTAVAVLMLTASMQERGEERQAIVQSTAILASALGIDPDKAIEIVRAGAADMGTAL